MTPTLPDHEREIIAYILQFAPLSDPEIQAIIASMNIRTYEKGTVLLREGQVADLCYFILKGCVRQYYLIDGVERTTHFYTEGRPVTPYEGTFQQRPSKFYLLCLEDTTLTAGSMEVQEDLFRQFPRFEAIARQAVEEELGKSQDELASYIIGTPEARYRDLLENRPDLIDRVPQYHLASYLGITPESLSRIRKRMMRGAVLNQRQ